MSTLDQSNNQSAWATASTGFSIVTNVAPNEPNLDNFNDGVSNSDNTPTLQFDITDNDVGDMNKYQIQIDNNADFSSPEIDSLESSFAVTPRNNETFTTTPLASGTYYWRVKAIDDDGLESNWSVASTGFTIDTTLPSSTILYPQDTAILKKVESITGKSTDNISVDSTRISILDQGTGLYYNGSDFSVGTETWLTTTGTTSWYYAAPIWVNGRNYIIRSRAMDTAGNEEHTDAITFTYDTINGVEGSVYVSNPAYMNNADYKLYYPNTAPVPTNGYMTIDFTDVYKFSPWMEETDITFTNTSNTITSSSDLIDRTNKTITTTITGGNVPADDMIELSINNLRIHNPSQAGSYNLVIKLYDNIGSLLESGSGMITIVEPDSRSRIKCFSRTINPNLYKLRSS